MSNLRGPRFVQLTSPDGRRFNVAADSVALVYPEGNTTHVALSFGGELVFVEPVADVMTMLHAAVTYPLLSTPEDPLPDVLNLEDLGD